MPRFANRAGLPAIAVAAVAVLLAGCSGGPDDAGAPVATPTATPATASTAPTTTAPPSSAPTTTAPATTAPTTTAATGTALKVGLPGFPRALTDARGRAVYVFSLDRNGATRCAGACATAWPPVLTTGQPTISGPGAQPGQVGIQGRGNEQLQVSYAGWPLYYFIRDTGPGTANGVGRNVFGGRFSLILVNGDRVDSR